MTKGRAFELVYGDFIQNSLESDVTAWCVGDNAGGSAPRYDMTLFNSVDGGRNWLNPIPIAGIVGVGKRVDFDLRQFNLAIDAFDILWHDGHLNWKRLGVQQAGDGYYFTQVGVAWHGGAMRHGQAETATRAKKPRTSAKRKD